MTAQPPTDPHHDAPAGVKAARALVEGAASLAGDAVDRVAGAVGAATDAVGPVMSAAATIADGASGARRHFRDRPAARQRRLTARNRERLPSLYDLHPQARLAALRDLGLRTVPVEQIKGTAVEGSDQRGADFLPPRALRTNDWQQRWTRINRAVRELVILPPVELVKFGDDYWVVDGHNRVAAALYHDQVAVDASVVERRLPGMPADREPGNLAAALTGSEELRSAGMGRRVVGGAPPGAPVRRTPHDHDHEHEHEDRSA